MEETGRANGYDVAIVGGGNLGLWTAYSLARQGVRRVVVLERGWAGWGATSRSAGMIRQQGGTATAIVLGRRSRELYLQIGREIGLDSGFVETGYFVVATTPEDAEIYQRHIALHAAHGLATEWVDPADGPGRFPGFAWDRFAGATYCATDGYVHPPLVARNITLAAMRAGVEIREHTEVLGIAPGGAGFRLETARGMVQAERVVDAGGPRGARQLAEMIGVTLPVSATRHQVVSYATLAEGQATPFPMTFAVGDGYYIRPEEQGAMVGVSNPAERSDTSGRYQMGFDWDFHEKMRPVWEGAFPALAGQPISRVWAASIDYTPDHLPVIDEAPGVPGCYLLAAGGHGMMCGPGLGEAMAELIVTGTVEELPAAEIHLARFADGATRPPRDQIALPFPEE